MSQQPPGPGDVVEPEAGPPAAEEEPPPAAEVATDDEPPAEEPEPDTCADCGVELIDPNAEACPNCGSSVDVCTECGEELPDPIPEACPNCGASVDVFVCTECGAVVAEWAEICPNPECGVSLIEDEEPEDEEPPVTICEMSVATPNASVALLVVTSSAGKEPTDALTVAKADDGTCVSFLIQTDEMTVEVTVTCDKGTKVTGVGDEPSAVEDREE